MTSAGYVVPSSGLMAITYVLEEASGPGDDILIAGFDHRGWIGHPFDAERMLIERYIAQDRLRRISAFQPQYADCVA